MDEGHTAWHTGLGEILQALISQSLISERFAAIDATLHELKSGAGASDTPGLIKAQLLAISELYAAPNFKQFSQLSEALTSNQLLQLATESDPLVIKLLQLCLLWLQQVLEASSIGEEEEFYLEQVLTGIKQISERENTDKKQIVEYCVALFAHILQHEPALEEAKAINLELITNISEYGHVINFMRSCINSGQVQSLGDKLIKCMASYGLTASVRLSFFDEVHVVSTCDPIAPRERKLLELAQGGRKVFLYNHRCFFCSESVVLLIKNMPVGDEDKVGRLKDHLAIILDAAQEKLAALKKDRILKQSLDSITDLLGKVGRDFKEHGTELIKNIDVTIDQFNMTLFKLDLTEEQEVSLMALLETKMQQLVSIYMKSTYIEKDLEQLTQELGIHVSTVETGEETSDSDEPDDDVTLF